MGRSYRTLSPRREPYYAEGEEITPKLKLNLRRPIMMDTPPGSPSDGFNPSGTPTKQTVSTISTFGLLTPCTPNFGDFFRHTPASPATLSRVDDSPVGEQHDGDVGTNVDDGYDSDEPLATQFDKLQQQIRDAELAASLSEEAISGRSRRSTRLALKDVVKAVPTKPVEGAATIESKKPASPVAPARNVSSPESSLAADAVVHLPPDVNPAVLTLDWQLQYPPGGSTHPSYPYPQMDPRLFFDPVHVPIVDGLPNVFRVAPLLLPIGWRHVSWSGFLPIVFDPYQQAFKLTPIGPLPLPCEEVHQGGLAKYVPGGKEHPEAGLLPDVVPLSDGLDVLYNFEGVDWTLPWPKGGNFDGSRADGMSSATRGYPSPTSSAGARSAIAKPAILHYVEDRDCPDNVIDIHDAWRSIAEKCDASFFRFEPTSGKSWKNTGITATIKKMKQPIASLLASALAQTIASPANPIASYLIKQNKREFCQFKSVSPPVHVNITLLGDIEFTLKELLCFFPSHYMWRKGGDRLFRSGMPNGDIAAMLNMTRQLSGDSSKKTDAISRVLNYETASDGSGEKVRIVRYNDETEAHGYTAEGWTFDAWELIDYPILALAHGVVTLPEGPDAGPLTELIKYCEENGKYNVMLGQVSGALQEAGISSLIESSEGTCPDKEVLHRHAAMLKEDKKRVKETLKRSAEEAGSKPKRMKFE